MELIKKIFEEYYNGDKNFMTSHVYGYAQKKFGNGYLVFEKSEGKGLMGEKLYGCSVLIYNSENGNTQKIDLSQCFYTPKDVEAHIDNMTQNDFENAKRYGEIKKILD